MTSSPPAAPNVAPVDRLSLFGSLRARLVIAVVVVVFVAGLLAFDRPYLAPYDSASGQLALLAIAAMFAGSLVAMERMGRVRAPERFIGRRTSISASAALEEARP